MTVWSRLPTAASSDVGSANPPAEVLRRDVATGRTSHAYLFSGAAGRLPRDTARAFAAALVCPGGGCGSCESCRRVDALAHPDVEWVEPAGMQLLVEQVRDVVRSAWRRPVAGSARVIVVEGADRMNPNAQNAFLKALEEPPPSTVIVLITAVPDALLDTVRSRCREVVFRSPTEDEVAAALIEEGIDPARASALARAAGSYERALELATDTEAARRRREVVERAIEPGRDPGEALEAAAWLVAEAKTVRESVAEVHKAELAEHADWYSETKQAADARLRREQRRAEQEALSAALDDVASALRDLLVERARPGAVLVNAELRPRIAALATALGPRGTGRVLAALDAVDECRRRLRINANVQLAVEQVFLALQRELVGRSFAGAPSSSR